MAAVSPAVSQSVAKPVPAPDSFEALFEESLTRQEMRIGEVITAEVVRLDQNFVVVNAGLKSESFIALEEFRDDGGALSVKPGDFVSVSIEALEDGYGNERAGWELEYCARIAVEMMAHFYDGIYRRYNHTR